MNKPPGKYSNAPGRWAGFGPYYAMFPVNFARQVVETMTPKGGSVLDPFCGRGTAPFVAQATGRAALGIDMNPVAWVFAKVKTSPEPEPEKLLKRLEDLQRAVRPEDRKPENEFQKWAWSGEVLGFLNAARRELDWQENITDRTLMGFILVNLHGRPSDGVSNQMQKSRAMGPDYAVRWWKKRKMCPPDIDPCVYFRQRIGWRYVHGVIEQKHVAEIIHGNSSAFLSDYPEKKFDLLFTSPPYFSVTDYRQDSWIRLWLLDEGPPLPDWKKDKRTTRQECYRQMLRDVFSSASRLLKPHSVIWVRTDARTFTKNTTIETLRALWPRRKLFMRHDCPRKDTQTAHFGNTFTKSGEIDFLIPGRKYLPTMSPPWKQL